MVSVGRIIECAKPFTQKGYRLARKQTLPIEHLQKYLNDAEISLPKGISIFDNARNFEEVVIQKKLNSSSALNGVNEKRILSLKDSTGKLLQRIRIGSDNTVNKVTNYDYGEVVLPNQMDTSPFRFKPDSKLGKPIHHKRQITSFHNGEEGHYKEIDVITFKTENNKKAIKTTYETMPQLFGNLYSSETTKIENCGKKKSFYTRTSYYENETGKVENYSSSVGWDKNTDFINFDKYLHCKVQSNPQRIARSALNQMGLKDAKLSFEPLNETKYGYETSINGKEYIVINDKLDKDETFTTAIHEGTHAIQHKLQLRYISELIKGKSIKEIEKYANENNDTRAYLYKEYLKLDDKIKDKVAKIAYYSEKLTKEEIASAERNAKEFENYVQPEKDYLAYYNQFIEKEARDAGLLAQVQRNFYNDEYNVFLSDKSANNRYLFIG